jgi:hypothetical protein
MMGAATPNPKTKPPSLTVWERRIIGAFIERYPSSAAAAISGSGECPDEEERKPRPQRLRPEMIFPGINGASPDQNESFLEAAESLESRGLLTLVWAAHRKGEILSALVCRDPELLYQLAGKPSPKTTAENVRVMARHLAIEARHEGGLIFSFLAENVTPMDAAGGIDVTAAVDLAALTRFLFDEAAQPALQKKSWQERVRGITTRALSTALYGDSKRLEALMTLFNPLLTRARRRGIAVPDFSFLDRAYPETFIAGRVVLDFGEYSIPAGGIILGLPLETILKMRGVRPLSGETSVLTIENKETFFALSESLPDYGCFLYAGGHPNRAVRALVSLLAESGFTFSHAGDLDPDGILILQELAEIAGKPVKPLRMDAGTFDRYLLCGRKLEPSTLRRTALIGEKTRSIPGITELVSRIEETGIGVEQEIIDYRE